nr:hypothetical protein [Tanacetum cinerariifolium]
PKCLAGAVRRCSGQGGRRQSGDRTPRWAVAGKPSAARRQRLTRASVAASSRHRDALTGRAEQSTTGHRAPRARHRSGPETQGRT